jgi:Glucodextranase, domain B
MKLIQTNEELPEITPTPERRRRRGRPAAQIVGFLLLVALGSLALVACGSSSQTPAASSVTLQIAAPVNGSAQRADRVTVRGTVTPADATVQIVGQPAQVGNGVFAGSVALQRGANAIDVVASAPGFAPATETITVKRTVPTRPKAKAVAVQQAPVAVRQAPPLASATDCGGGLTAGAHTSCPFAENVRAAFESTGSGVLDVYSPTTGQTYRMYCTSGSPHVCTGGNGASVYFSSGSIASAYSLGDCGGDLSVGPNTSCAFAQNVQATYYQSGPGWNTVYSPVTDQTYSIYCTANSPHVCTGGNNAAVYFP